MKKLKKLLLILTSITLASCGTPKECESHIDSNHDGKCDVCQKEVSVNHIDSNHDNKCDICGAAVSSIHIDSKHTGKCEICGADVPVNHIDNNGDGLCDVCGKEASDKHIDNNNDGKCDICGIEVSHIDNNDDNICDYCGADLSKEISIHTIIKTDKWNQDLRDYIGYVLGKENDKAIPQMPAPGGYKAYLEEIPYEDGSGSQIAAVINCYNVNAETCCEDYEKILVNNGFYIGYSTDYGYKILNETTDLIVQYSYVERQGSKFLELIIYTAETRVSEWPGEKIFTLLGAEIPVYLCDSYEFYYYIDESYAPIAVVYDHNVGINGLVNYHNQIMATGNYTLTANTADGYSYLSKDGKIVFNIYPTADEYNRDSIYITISNNWPYFYISMMLGEDIPTFTMETMEYMFQDMDDDGTAEYLTIFYDQTSDVDFANHVNQFINAGWHIDEELSTVFDKILTKVIDGKTKTVEVVYSSTYSSICVAFTE